MVLRTNRHKFQQNGFVSVKTQGEQEDNGQTKHFNWYSKTAVYFIRLRKKQSEVSICRQISITIR